MNLGLPSHESFIPLIQSLINLLGESIEYTVPGACPRMLLEIGAKSPERYEVFQTSFLEGVPVGGRHRCAEFEVEAEVLEAG